LAPLYSGAQPLSEIPYPFKLEAAEESYAKKDYYNAVDWYEQCYQETREMELAIKIADCHYKLRDYKRAERWYRRIVQKDVENTNPEAKFIFGLLLKMNGNYDEAEEVLYQVVTEQADPALMSKAKLELDGIKLAKSMKRPDDLLVESLGRNVNTRYTESSPALDAEGNLYYITFNTDEVILVEENNKDYHARVYQTRLNNRGNWEKGREFNQKMDRPGFHNSHISFSQNGDRLYFTRAVVSGGELTSSLLYYCDGGSRGWGAPQEIESLNGRFLNQHPVTGDLFGSEVLLFSSDRPGGFGGMDLYYCPINQDGSFGQPVNLGEPINSEGDDLTPFYQEGTLYFSSNGWPGLGGFDIFKSEWNGTSWQIPQNMGKGFNSSVDDLYFSLGGEDSGFLVSNRDGTRSVKSNTCCDDIFTFAKKEIIINLIAIVFEEETPLPGATIHLYEKIGEELGYPDIQTNSESNEFDFALDSDKAYRVIVGKEGFSSDTADFNTVGVRESKIFRGTFRLKRAMEITEPETEIITRNEPIRLNNIYYDFDDDKILPDAEGDLDFVYDLMVEYPDMVIELSSHTDSRGNDAYNADLSQRRANSAKRYLEIRGIDPNRVRAVGYGESRILNSCTNGVQCTETEHRLNRRTEFEIIAGPQSIEVKREVRGSGSGPLPRGGNGNDGGASLELPVILLEKDRIDLGAIKQGEKTSGQFKITNIGNSDLSIDLVSACECTTIDWPQHPLKPGQSGMISLEYDSTDKEGEQEVSVEIAANTDPVITTASFTVFVRKIE